MATKLELGKKKWVRKVKGEKWKKGVTGKENAFCEGVAKAAGKPTCNPEIAAEWRAGVDAVSAADFDAAVRGKEDKWMRRWIEKMTG